MMEKSFTCIVCPKSCGVIVRPAGDALEVTGNECRRGAEYAENEYRHPMRAITSTVKVTGGIFPRMGVAGTKEVPREKLRDCLAEIYRLAVPAPVEEGQQVGRMVVTSGGEVLSELPLVADRPVARLTYWQILERCLQAAFMGG